MISVTFKDRIRNGELRRRTKLADVIKRIDKLKGCRAGHISKLKTGDECTN